MEYGQVLKMIMVASLLVQHPSQPNKQSQFVIKSSAFQDAGIIPKIHTCYDKSISVPLSWTGIPKGTKSLTLLIIDEDVPRDHWYHWALYDIPPTWTHLPANVQITSPVQIAKNSWGNKSYEGPCPPSGEHHYVVHLYALNTKLSRSKNETVLSLRRKMRNHIIASTEIMGRVEATPQIKAYRLNPQSKDPRGNTRIFSNENRIKQQNHT